MDDRIDINVIGEVLKELGIVLEDNPPDNVLADCIEDSIAFITFLAEIENRFDICFPDELIDYSLLNSLDLFIDTVNKMC